MPTNAASSPQRRRRTCATHSSGPSAEPSRVRAEENGLPPSIAVVARSPVNSDGVLDASGNG
jgi:hypothetical protein